MEYSPMLSLATGLFEVGAATWILRGDNERPLRRLLAILLGLLAGYQFLEWQVCSSPGSTLLARLAFADIVWLPPVGLYLIVTLAQPKRAWVRKAAWGFLGGAAVWTVAVLTVPDFLSTTVCKAVFATYKTRLPLMYSLYGLFYDIGLMALLFGGLLAASKCENERNRAMISDFVLGNLAFGLAALMTMVAFPVTRGSSPSILCHYALMLALAIAHMGYRLREEEPRLEQHPA